MKIYRLHGRPNKITSVRKLESHNLEIIYSTKGKMLCRWSLKDRKHISKIEHRQLMNTMQIKLLYHSQDQLIEKISPKTQNDME
jgi:hypothetical protein